MSDDLIAGRYELAEKLGTGGMSTVRLAFDRRLERHVAVKLLAEHLADDSQFVSRFRREALSAARLVHPNIVQVFDYGFEDESQRYYIVMEHVRGRSGADILRERGYLSVPETLELIGQACRGLDYAHRNGVIHRDVKPGNILRSDDGTVKIADFGIAKALAEESSITQIGSVLGTASYLAPEQATGSPVGPGADVYALGVVTYQCLAGRLPYEAGSLTELAAKQQAEAPPLLDQLNAEVGPELGLVVDRALALEPDQRYPSADALGDALEQGAAGVTGPDPGGAATRIVSRGPDTGATMIAPGASDAERIARDFETGTAERAPLEERTRVGQAPPRTAAAPAARRGRPAQAPPPAARPAKARREKPPRAPKRRRGCLGRLVRMLVVLLVLAAIVGAVVYYVLQQAAQIDLRDVVFDQVDRSSQELRQLIQDNTAP